MNIYQFMSDSPFLTFFLALFATNAVVGVARAIMRVPAHIKCDCENNDDND